MKQGEIRRLLATTSVVPIHVLVLSGPRYLSADKGKVVVCRVVPGTVPDDFTSVHRVTYQSEGGVDTIGLAVPDLSTGTRPPRWAGFTELFENHIRGRLHSATLTCSSTP